MDLLNDLYTSAWNPYNNFFCPCMKLVSKIRINSRYVKKYDSPKTPYQRLIDSEHVSDHTKKRLTETFLSLNPFALKKMIESKLKIIFNTLQRPSL